MWRNAARPTIGIPTVVVIALALLASACTGQATLGQTQGASDDEPTASATVAADSSPAPAPSPDDVGEAPTGVASDDSAPAGSDAPPAPASRAPSQLLPLVSLLYTGEAQRGGDVERDLGELVRCVAADLGEAVPSDPLAGLDLFEPIEALLGAADPQDVAIIADAMDRCIPVAVVITQGFLEGSIEREHLAQALCAITALDPDVGWLDLAGYYSGGPFPFGDAADAAEDDCDELPGSGEPLSEAEELIEQDLRAVGELVGFELEREERRCIVVAIRGEVDPDAVFDLEDPDPAILEPVLDAFDACIPVAGWIAEQDDGGIVQALCLHRQLADTDVGWRELFELGLRFERLGIEAFAIDPVFVALDRARASCYWSSPGVELVALDEVLEIEALLHDGTYLWVVGVDDGADRPGNVALLDGETGEVLRRIDTEPFAVEIVASNGVHAWVASEDGGRVQRVTPADGTTAPAVELPGRAVGDLQWSGDVLWATDNNAGSLLRLDGETGELLDEIAIAPGEWFSSDLAVAAGWLWLTNREDPVVRQLDPVTGELVAEHLVESEFTMHLLDLGGSVGVYGFSQLWRIDPEGPGPEQLIDFIGRESLSVDAATVVGGRIAFVDDQVSLLALYDPVTDFIEEMRFIPGPGADGRDRITSDGVAIWLGTLADQVVRFD